MNASYLPPPEWLENFRKASCSQCPFKPAYGRTPQVPAECTGTNPVLALVGEAPGEAESKEGRPFIGRSGMLLRSLLAKQGLIGKPMLITNVVKCRPENNRTPTLKEASLCRPLLEWELQQLSPRAILTLGKTASNSLLGANTAIASIQGDTHTTDFGDVIPTYHPAAALRNPALVETIRRDLLQAMEIGKAKPVLELPVTYLNGPALERLSTVAATLEPDIRLVLDLETNGLDPFKPGAQIRLIGVRLVGGPNETYHFALPESQAAFGEWLHRAANSLSCGVIGHNVKFDLLWLRVFGILRNDDLWKPTIWDTLANYALLDEECPRKGLKALCTRLFGLKNWGLEDVLGAPLMNLIPYNSMDLYATELLYEWERKFSIPWQLNDIGTLTAIELETRGIKISRERLQALFEQEAKDRASLEKSLSDVVGNPRSTKQLADFLYAKHRLKPPLKTEKGAPSTNEESLRILLKTNLAPEIRTILETLLKFREIDKRLHYIVKFAAFVSPDATVDVGAIHPRYEICRHEHWPDGGVGGGTVTGRFSSHSPNIQQQTGSMFSVLESRFPGGKLLVPDLSQIEIRILAHMSKDPELIAVCKSGDLHGQVADTVVAPRVAGRGWDAEQVRRLAKTINFGVAYLISPKGLMKKVPGMDLETATEFIDAWYARFKGVAQFQAAIKAKVITTGVVDSLFGRLRHLPGANTHSPSGMRVIRQAVNFPIQEGAAELLRNGIMPTIMQQLHERRSKVIANIHDALILDVHPEEEEEVRAILHAEMTNPALPPGGIGLVYSRWNEVSEVPITYGFKEIHALEPVDGTEEEYDGEET